jgi:hypothetical protein
MLVYSPREGVYVSRTAAMSCAGEPLRPGAGPGDNSEVQTVGALLDEASAQAHRWFPELDSQVHVSLSTVVRRPRSSLHLIALAGVDGKRRTVVAKVRIDTPNSDLLSRPSMAAGPPLSAGEQAALEYAGLRAIRDEMAGDPRFGVVNVLGHLATPATVFMERVEQPTLRDVLLRQSRLRPRLRIRKPPGADQLPWTHAGAWLHGFHSLSEGLPPASGEDPRDRLLVAFESFGDFIAARTGDYGAAQLARRAREVAAVHLPTGAPLAVSHGDFAVRNMFCDGRGRVTGFDPLPRGRVPVYQDVCRFIDSVRLLGLQVYSHGAAYSRESLDARERAFLQGYYGADEPPTSVLRAFELLILLDKWTAFTTRRALHPGRRVQDAAAHAYMRREIVRLLERAERHG